MTDEHRTALVEAAAAARELIEVLRTRDVPAEELKALGTGVRALCADLVGRPEAPQRDFTAETGGMIWDDTFSPIAGECNPLAPPVTIRVVRSGEVVGTGTWGTAWQGPEGYVHGGMIAAAFDELLGDSQPEASGMTARLEIDYRSPAPLHTELTLHSELESREGRKTWVRGTLRHGDHLLAEARGLFVRPRQD